MTPGTDAEEVAGLTLHQRGDGTIVLPTSLGYPAAALLHETLLAAVDDPVVILDASAVQSVSTAAVLVIASFLNARETISPPAAIVNATGPLVDAFSELGMFAVMMRMEFR